MITSKQGTLRILGSAGVVTLVMALVACGGPTSTGGESTASEPGRLVVAGLGGSIDENFAKVSEKFEAENNVQVEFVPGTSVENVAKIANSQPNPEYDIVVGNDMVLYAGGDEGLWATLDESIVTNLANVYPVVVPETKFYVGVGMNAVGMYYAPKVYEENGWDPPTSYADLFKYLDDEEYCGRIGMEHPDVALPLEAAYSAGKGDIPEGIRYLSGLKDCIPVLEPNSAKYEASMQAGTYVVGVYNSLHTIPLVLAGADLRFFYPTEGGVSTTTALAPVKNSPNPEMAQKFINFFLTEEVQNMMVNDLAFGPTIRGIEVDQAHIDAGVPTAEVMENLLLVPLDEWNAHRAEWSQYFIEQFS